MQFRHALLLCMCFALTACENLRLPELSWPSWARLGSFAQGQAVTCPEIAVVPELSSLTQFDDFYAGPPDDDKIQAISLIESAGGVCRQHGDMLEVDLTLTFITALGTLGQDDLGKNASFAFPYFAAVTDTSGAIRAKDVFATSLSFTKPDIAIQKIERLTQTIPLPSRADAANTRILIGFQLAPEQLSYNRSHPMPEIPALARRNAITLEGAPGPAQSVENPQETVARP